MKAKLTSCNIKTDMKQIGGINNCHLWHLARYSTVLILATAQPRYSTVLILATAQLGILLD